MENAGDLCVYYNNTNLGNFYNGDGKYYYYSDRRVKTNIEPIPSALVAVMALRPVEYEMKYTNPGHMKSIGLIAQEVKPLFPLMVRQVNDHSGKNQAIPDDLTMDYSGFGVIAIKALQEQQKQLQDLEKEKLELLARLEKQEKALAGN